MRELASREYTPTLAYAAGVLFLTQFLVSTGLGEPLAAVAIHLLFIPVLVLLVMRVDAAPWARLSGYAWAGLALLADLAVLAALVVGGNLGGALVLANLALLPGAAWILGASMADAGAGRALGAAASAGMAFAALLSIADRIILAESQLLVRLVAMLTLALSIAWFVVLGRDLARGERHWTQNTGPHAGPGAPRG
jgi:hypothetical protein